jgi:hypothetical protein
VLGSGVVLVIVLRFVIGRLMDCCDKPRAAKFQPVPQHVNSFTIDNA